MGTTSPHLHHPHHHHHHHQPHHFLTKKLLPRSIYVLLPLALLHLYLFGFPSSDHTTTTTSQTLPQPLNFSSIPSPSLGHQHPASTKPRCKDYSEGRWVRSSRALLYNGTSCGTIKDGQNCMAHGRPDTGYLYWRWQPDGDGCELPPFDPATFLDLIRNKHLAFIGDSMARNQLESLLCLLSSSSASQPDLAYRDGDDNKFRRWRFPSHNATVSVFWSPFLVKGIEKSAASGLAHNKLYLDSPDERWASELDGIDVVVFSIGHWFLHPAVYHEGGEVLGCHHCPGFNHTEIGFFDVFRKAVRTALREVGRKRGKYVMVTTFSPAHFEGEWDKAGACPKTEPYQGGEKEMEYMDREMRKIEVEEVARAAAEGRRSVGFEALDVTKLALMRPDGHPGPYMYPDPFANGNRSGRVQNDCVHWCLPGPIDTWNEIFLEKLRRWK